jgi:hypothetical protein
MKATLLIASLSLAALFATEAHAANKALSCKKQDGNVCYRIGGVESSRIDHNQAFQKALRAVGQKMQGKSVVYIVQGYRTPGQQQALVNQHCGGRSSCAGYASARTSRHVISIAADPMLYGNQLKSVCYAENQARVEFLGPRSAAAVYGYDRKTNLTWAHIDDSTNSNYTPRNCGRNEGLNGNEKVAADSGAPVSKRVQDYQKKKAARDPASVTQDASSTQAVGGSCGYYAILECAKTSSAAQGEAQSLGGALQVIHTDDVSGFAPGWYCVTAGKTTQGAAAATVQSFKRKSAGYVKKGC